MAITLNLYSFTKRENSTKQPTGTAETFSCTMLDNTSLMTPTFKLSAAANPVGYNYAYVSNFNRYYFITDISTYQNFWYISCTCDVLATYKDTIGTSSHYVLRSASDHDGDISDTVYPAKVTASEVFEVLKDSDPLLRSNGYSYVVGIVGPASSSTKQFGSLTYYMFDEAAFQYFINWLMSNIDNWSGLSGEYSQGVQKALIDPMQYIKSCMLMPFGIPSGAPAATVINFGYYQYTVGGSGSVYEITNTLPVYTEACHIDVPKHPDAATRGNYLNCQPFSSYTLHVGPFGDIPLDPFLLQENDEITLAFALDLISGNCRLVVNGSTHTMDIFFNGCAQVGVAINLSQVFVDGLAQTQAETNAIFSMLGAGLSGSPAGFISIANAATSGIQDATRLDYPTVSGLGSGGTMIPFYDNTYNIYLLCKFLEPVAENLAEIGRPLCQTKQINTMTGFILCMGADCQISGTQEEAQKINGYMNSGFFYE